MWPNALQGRHLQDRTDGNGGCHPKEVSDAKSIRQCKEMLSMGGHDTLGTACLAGWRDAPISHLASLSSVFTGSLLSTTFKLASFPMIPENFRLRNLK